MSEDPQAWASDGLRLEVTWQLLRTATGVTAFAGLYYTVTLLLDAVRSDLRR